MANNNEPKGSKWNPYSSTEFENAFYQSHTWNGGWVQSGSNTVYVNIYGISYPNPYSGILGSIGHPFTLDQRETIMNEHSEFWPGGWAEKNQGGDLAYYLANNFYYEQTNDQGASFGSASYPCPLEVYSNMCENGIWESGYVQGYDKDGIPITYYISGAQAGNGGSGSGSGSSSGSGSGSESGGSGSGSESGGSGSGYGLHLTAGEQVVGCDGNVDIVFHWEPHSAVTIEAGYRIDPHPSGNIVLDKIERSTLSVSWNGNNLFTLDGNITYSYNKINPITNCVLEHRELTLGLQIPYVSI
jgi:hypothetical protein